MKKTSILLLVIFCLFKSGEVSSQNPFRQLKVESWDTKNGLPNDLILNVYQTKDGFIWTAGYTGLTRFDGVSFTSYNSRSVPLFKTDNIQSLLYETNDSTLWIPTPSSGLLSFKNGVFNAYLTDSTSINFLGTTDREELLLQIGTRTQSFVLFDTNLKTSKSITYSQGRELFKEGKISNKYRRLKDQSGNLWTYTDASFFSYKDGKMNKITPKEGGFPERQYFLSCVDSKNRFWLTSNKGLFLWDGQAFKPYPGMEDILFGGSGAASTGSILEDSKGNIWLATTSGLAYLDAQSDRFVFFPKSESLLSQPIFNILEDKEGNIWVSSANGLIKLSQSKFINYSELDGLNNNRISAVCALDNHRYLVATSRKLFLIEDGVVKPYPFKNKNLTNFRGDITHIFKDSSDNIWICFAAGNIIRISKSGEKLFSNGGAVQARYVFEDDNRQVWFGLAFGGIGFLNNEDQIELLSFPKIDFKSLHISSIRKLRNGNWLLTSFNKGILIIDQAGNPAYFDDKSGLQSIGVFSSVEDPDGTVWLTTQAGIVRYKNGEFGKIDFTSGLPENSIFGFLPDQKGYVWFPSNRGLIRAKKQELNDYLDKKIDKIEWQLYDDGDGMLNRQAVGARHPAVTPDGRLLFVTFGGLVEVDPDQLKKNLIPPSVIIHNVQFDGKDIGLAQANTFKPGNHRYIFEYSGLSFVSPEKVKFKFKLVGYDKDWISAVGDRKAFYTNIPSGSYTFQVIASNNDGIWNDTGATYSFTIEPFFHETAWFRILTLIILSLLIWLIVKWRTSAARKQNELLEIEVASRTSDLNKANFELNQSLENLKSTQAQLIQSEKMASLGELTAGIAHEIQNPLNFVNNFSEVSAELVDEIQDIRRKTQDKARSSEEDEILEDIKQNLEKINHHGKRADAIVKGMLEHSRAGKGEKAPTDINALADEYLRLSYHGLRAKDKSFTADFATDFDPNLPKVNVVASDIGRVLLNLINNAFYACGNSEFRINNSELKPQVKVSTKNIGNKIEIKVSDNGPGIPSSIKDKIFQPFFTTKPTGQGTGLGLSLSYDIVKAHGGELKVETKEGEGSTFIIQIPTA
ncbi:sensor histidine kinase [Cognataquiflexum rubidum]|uniref:sensor histidine kinase n=1 Tax=Cognataquiflexum rubidum TaxID=2922273 RepID=UPI001F12F9F5|nr:sensor histidine kinase [Cognataquiflexum rubidum]MCH6235775.1 ATP-binding protein [Cognataquiflexum rubidum]